MRQQWPNTDMGTGGGVLAIFMVRRTEEEDGSTVIPLDEMEKVHDEVLHPFLPAFDEGYLTDARGVRQPRDGGRPIYSPSGITGPSIFQSSKRRRRGAFRLGMFFAFSSPRFFG